MWQKIQETIAFLKQKNKSIPEVGIILGSGLGNLIDDITIEHSIEYSDIPHFPVSTVEGHTGRLIFGTLSGKKVVAMQGRFHYYEGYSMQEVTFPIRVMKFLGIKTLIVSNASGGVNPSYEIGDIMIIKDHINMFPEHPLRGYNDSRLGPRFVNMSQPYNLNLIKNAEIIAQKEGLNIKTGIYYGLSGPTFETLAEYNMIRIVGADCVGMSTVPEVIVARHMDIDVFGISVISDMGTSEGILNVNHDEVLKAVANAEPKVRMLIQKLLYEIDR